MKCEKCKQKEATFFYEENINGHTRSYRLCQDCAAKLQKETDMFPDFSGSESFPFFPTVYPSVLGNLFALPTKKRRESSKVCPGCGSSFEDLVSLGKACCPQCYSTFEKELENTVRSIHGNVTHTGRAPAMHRAKHEKENKLEKLKISLREAVEKENFEEAAKLRDEIRSLGENKE